MATHATLRIAGMDCADCASRLGQAFERAEGVVREKVDPGGAAMVRYDEARIGEAEFGERVRAAGFELAWRGSTRGRR